MTCPKDYTKVRFEDGSDRCVSPPIQDQAEVHWVGYSADDVTTFLNARVGKDVILSSGGTPILFAGMIFDTLSNLLDDGELTNWPSIYIDKNTVQISQKNGEFFGFAKTASVNGSAPYELFLSHGTVFGGSVDSPLLDGSFTGYKFILGSFNKAGETNSGLIAPPAPPKSYCEKLCTNYGGCVWSSGTKKLPSVTGSGKLVYQVICKDGWVLEGETTESMITVDNISSLFGPMADTTRHGGPTDKLRKPASGVDLDRKGQFGFPGALTQGSNVKLPKWLRLEVVNPGDTLGSFLTRHRMDRDKFFALNLHKEAVELHGLRTTYLQEFELLIVG